MNSKLIIPFIVCLMAFSISAGSAQAQTEVAVEFQWTAPTTGSPVDYYVIEHSVDGGAWTQVATATATTYTLTAAVGNSHQIRVAGVDAQGRQGVYSAASDPYTPDIGAPGQPGKPIIF